MTDKEICTQYKALLVTAAHILLSAENAVTEAYETAKTPNEIAGTLIDVPAQLKRASTLIKSVLILNRRVYKGEDLSLSDPNRCEDCTHLAHSGNCPYCEKGQMCNPFPANKGKNSKPKLYPANVNGKRVMVTIPED